jgi:hypothetical protein
MRSLRIFEYFTELIRPPRKEKQRVDLTLDFDQLPLFIDRADKAA